MLHAGIGETHVNNVLSSINIPPVCSKTVKKAEREIGVILEKCAKSKPGCDTHLKKECELTRQTAKEAQPVTTQPHHPTNPLCLATHAVSHSSAFPSSNGTGKSLLSIILQ